MVIIAKLNKRLLVSYFIFAGGNKKIIHYELQ
jgi:hypothetical protein